MANNGANGSQWLGYIGTVAMLVLAFLFPIGLMIFNPTLMFERGWEQYVGTGIYFWAVLTLSRELFRLWRNEQAFEEAPALLKRINASLTPSGTRIATAPVHSSFDDDQRILPTRVRQLVCYLKESRSPSVTQLMEVNREGSGLDQEHMAGRFTLTRYILYLLPVIGFIGTVEGISRALMNISMVLPMVKNLDGFLTNLTSVTAALQIAFDSTLLALFLSAALMLVQTLVFRRSEDVLARIDRWVVEHVLPRVGTDNPLAERVVETLGVQFDLLGNKLASVIEPAIKALEAQAGNLGTKLQAPIAQFAAEVEHLTGSLVAFQSGADRISRIGADLEAIGSASESLRRGVAGLARMEAILERLEAPQPQLEEIKRGIDRAGVAIESLAGSWSAAYERSSRATQEQLAHSLTSLKDALELLNVSMEQGNALYRSIVKKLFDERTEGGAHRGESIRVA
ncbi:MAG: MotA/TolQ/ExbB proton channel family protein [Isosphaeraceae bacterium]